jgi:hypothetical protein
MSGNLEALLKRAAQHKMTPAEEHAQRRSWVIGQMMLSHPEMTREEAERLADGAVGSNLAARIAELEAEVARLKALVDPPGERVEWMRTKDIDRLQEAEAENARLREAARQVCDYAGNWQGEDGFANLLDKLEGTLKPAEGEGA